MKSKTHLFNHLNGTFGTNVTLDDVSNETFGRKSYIFFYDVISLFKTTRKGIETGLENAGFKVNRKWMKGHDQCVSVQVSYFKGRHWNQ